MIFEFRHKDCHLDKEKNLVSTSFSLERDVTDINEVGPVFCPQCGKKRGEQGVSIEWVVVPLTFGVSKSTIARDNKNMSEDAQARASAAQRELDREDPLQTITAPKGLPISRYAEPGGARIRKSIVDKIQDRVQSISVDDIGEA